MSSILSSLPSYQSLPPAPSSDDVMIRLAPRRTYGRTRIASPPVDQDHLPSLLQHSAVTHVSPAKGLLNRWSVASTSWRDSLALLDASDIAQDDTESAKREMERLRREARTDVLLRRRSVTPPDEGEVDFEEAKMEMERMRRELRGEITSKSTAAAVMRRLEPPKAKVGIPFTSSLTVLSTSPPPSSPPRPRSEAVLGATQSIEEETMPIRRSGMNKTSGRPKRVIASSDTESSQDEGARHAVPTTRPRKASSPSDEDDRDNPRRPAAIAARPAKPAPPARPPTPDSDEDVPLPNMEQFLSTLAEEDKVAEKASQQSTESINDPVGLFDEDEIHTKKGKAGKGSKAIKVSKLDMLVVAGLTTCSH